MKISKQQAFYGQTVHVWGLDVLISITTQLSISQIIGENQDDVGRGSWFRCMTSKPTRQEEETQTVHEQWNEKSAQKIAFSRESRVN
jgi:hypothetical protein